MALQSWLGDPSQPRGYLRLILRLVRAPGLLPADGGRHLMAAALAAALLLHNATQVAQVHASWGDMAALSGAVPLALLVFGGIFRLTLYMVLRDTYDSITSQVGAWFVARSPLRGLRPMRSRLVTTRQLQLGFLVLLPLGAVWWVAYGLLAGGRALLAPALLPFSLEPPLVYGAVYACQCFCVILSGYLVGATDLLMATMCYLTAGQFAVLSDMVRCSSRLAARPEWQWLPPPLGGTGGRGAPSTARVLARCVQFHDRLLRLVADLESVNWFSMALNFYLILLIMSFLGYEALMSTEALDASKIARNSILLGFGVIQLFLHCNSSNNLMDAQLEVAEAAYESEWVGCPRSCSRSLWMMVTRARHIQKMTAGKVVDINLVLFSDTLTMAFSYFMVLQKLKGTS